jgi:hypothetical protein
VLELDVHAEAASGPGRLGLAQVEQVLEGEHADVSVVPRTGVAPLGPALARPQLPHLGEVEVLDEPAVLLSTLDDQPPAAPGELRAVGDVGGPFQVEVVATDEYAVAGADHVGLDGVGTAAPREPVGECCVLRAVPAGAAVPDDKWSSHDPTVDVPGDG